MISISVCNNSLESKAEQSTVNGIINKVGLLTTIGSDSVNLFNIQIKKDTTAYLLCLTNSGINFYKKTTTDDNWVLIWSK